MSQMNALEAAMSKAGMCTNPTCPYCGNKSEQVTGKVIYPHRKDLYTKIFYLCAPCDAYVGCHDKIGKPLGRLANKELRAAKVKAHAAFDPLWQEGESLTRTQAYAWLARCMGLYVQDCHIGMFDVEQCERVIIHANNLIRTRHDSAGKRRF